MRDPSDPYADEIASALPNPPPKLSERSHRDPAEIADCTLCDDDGYRGSQICHHHDYAPAARRGIAACQAARNHQPEEKN
nr:hypothetical protein [Mycobacterium sp. UM_NZ2]